MWVKDNAGRTATASFTIASTAFCSYAAGDVVKEFSYTGGIESLSIPCSGTYKLEVWGAQGGSTSLTGGYDGYSYGNISLSKNATLYIVVGGQGGGTGSGTAGYNGGGLGSVDSDLQWHAGGGGGLYGGGGGGNWNGTVAGSGGSGYIGGVTDGSMTNGQRSGDGYAKITLVSLN